MKLDQSQLLAALAALPKPKPKQPRPRRPAPLREAQAHTVLSPDQPAPRTQALIAERGPGPTAEALSAWNDRVAGAPIVDVAHNLGVSIELAKLLIREAHAAIGEDLKANLEVNRTIDLQRIDGLIRAHYPLACSGDEKAANVVLRALSHRAKLTGSEPIAEPTRTDNPTNVLVWIQAQLPAINRLVDSLPTE